MLTDHRKPFLEKKPTLFHRAHAEALASAGVDFLIASTLPAVPEALGMSEAMAGLGLPYIMSFIIGPQGTLLDGMPLHEAVASIDREITAPPAAYMVNCVHASAFRTAFLHEAIQMPRLAVRLVGLQANTSAKSPQELEGCPSLDTEEPEVFAEAMLALNRDLGIRVLGGCCGTDQRHIQLLATRWAERQA
jgi:homocysteine S-methyltransferase